MQTVAEQSGAGPETLHPNKLPERPTLLVQEAQLERQEDESVEGKALGPLGSVPGRL